MLRDLDCAGPGKMFYIGSGSAHALIRTRGTMKASIAGRVRNTNLAKAKALLPMFEAVMNAYQAKEEVGSGSHRIDVIAERQGDL
jgi:hypothetical protein